MENKGCYVIKRLNTFLLDGNSLEKSKLKAFADDYQVMEFVLEGVGNAVGSRDNVSYKHLSFPYNVYHPLLTLSQTSPGFHV